MEYYGIILAFLAGIFITTQGAINGMIGQKVGIYPTIIFPVTVQLILLGILLFIGKDFLSQVKSLKGVDYGYVYLTISAFLGLGIMSFMTYSIMRIGPLIAFAIAIFSQLFSSMLLENYGALEMTYHPMNIKRVIALGLMMIAVKLFME